MGRMDDTCSVPMYRGRLVAHWLRLRGVKKLQATLQLSNRMLNVHRIGIITTTCLTSLIWWKPIHSTNHNVNENSSISSSMPKSPYISKLIYLIEAFEADDSLACRGNVSPCLIRGLVASPFPNIHDSFVTGTSCILHCKAHVSRLVLHPPKNCACTDKNVHDTSVTLTRSLPILSLILWR